MTIRRVVATDGSPVDYDDRVIASGQKKDCCLCKDGQSVLLWFRDSLDARDVERLQAVIGSYRDRLFRGSSAGYWRQLMCWPDRMVEVNGRWGITAPRYPASFNFEYGSRNDDALKLRGKEKQGYWFVSLKHRTRTLDPRELGDWKRSLRMALRLARAVRRIHAAGLVHGDLSYRNVILDPAHGDTCLIDLDGLVVPGKYPPDVLGTPDFMAPEIVASRHLPKDHPNRKLPGWHADLHALAVLIYLLLLLRHPLRGDKIHDLDDDNRQEAMMMGAGARFVEDPRYDDNRIREDFLEPFERPWKDTDALPYRVLGPYLAPLIERAFVEGLHNPGLRPTAQEWESALLDTANLLHPCRNEQCEAGWFPLDASNLRCPFCRAPVQGPVHVAHLYQHNGKSFAPTGDIKVLHHHAAIHDWHLDTHIHPNEQLTPDGSRRRAYVAHDAEDTAWLVNEGIEDAQDLETRSAIAKGQSIAITTGMRILVKRTAPAHLIWIDTIPF